MTISTRLPPVAISAVEAVARQGIRRRLGHDGSTVYCSTELPAGTGVMLHVNSGGNALAAESALLGRGYVLGQAIKCCARPGCTVVVLGRRASSEGVEQAE